MFLNRKRLLTVCFLICLPLMAGVAVSSGLPDPLGSVNKAIVSVVLQTRDGEVLAAASGFIISEQGIVVTSSRTVIPWQEPEKTLVLKTFDGTILVAEEIIATDPFLGIALLKTAQTALPALRLQSEYPFRKDTRCYIPGGPAGSTLLLQGKIRKRLSKGDLLDIEEAGLPAESIGAPVLDRLGEAVAVVTEPVEKPGQAGSAVAISVVEKMLAEYRTRLLSRAWFELGLLYDAEKGRASDAAAAFKEATRLAPDYVEAYNNLSVIYGKAGKYDESIGVLQQVLKLRPDFAEAHFNLGIAYTRLGKYQEAVASFRRLLAVRANDADAHYLIAVAYLGMKDHAAARQELEIVSTLSPALYGKLEKLLRSGNKPAAPDIPAK
ncbi:MAG: hypothetical protein C0402_09570 [Thermodesulfovibrio sp.]|nr:hypothetical protein [Thermodesulfovibrio sp.]